MKEWLFKFLFPEKHEALEQSERLNAMICELFPNHTTIITGVGMARTTNDVQWILKSVKEHGVNYNQFSFMDGMGK